MRALFAFFESRLGLGELKRKLATEKMLPRGTSWLHTLGYAALSLFVLQGVTGVALAFFYVPAADHAYDSIRFLERDVAYGKLVRALHHWGASAMVVLVFLHALRVFFQGAYKRPREFTWLFGLGLAAVTIGFAFTGYLLPWDQKAYFATKVGVNIAAQAPGVGEHVRNALYGAEEIGPQTLNRFFALHVLVLPALLIVLLVAHLQQIQRHGVSPKGVPVGEKGVAWRPYHPYHTIKEALVAILVVGAVVVLAIRLGAGLEAEASAADLDYDPRPDWYFYAPFQLLKLFEGDLEVIGAFWLPAGFGALLVLLPFLDRNPERRLGKRKLAATLGVLFALSVIALTAWGMNDKPTHYATPPHPLGATPEVRAGYDVARRERCFACHKLTIAGNVYGAFGHDEHGKVLESPSLLDVRADLAFEDFRISVTEGSGDMPAFPHLDARALERLWSYLAELRAEKR